MEFGEHSITAAVNLTLNEVQALAICIDRYEDLVQHRARVHGYTTTNQGMIDKARAALVKINAAFLR